MAALTREQFIDQVLQYVKEKFPLVKIARGAEPFSMLVNGHLASMENVYRIAALQPNETRHHIERWVVELVRASEGTPDRTGSFEELRDRILPMIVADGERDRRTMVTEPLLEGLSVAYAIDSDRTIAYIPEQQFKDWSIDRQTLHETAIENLVKRSESMSAHAAQDEDGKINLILFQTMDGYDASRFLLPNLHEKLREHLGSPFVAAIPNRDILLCFRNDDDTVERLREQIEADHRRMPHGVTERLLLVTPDGIAPRD
jgi:hypothetical protein